MKYRGHIVSDWAVWRDDVEPGHDRIHVLRFDLLANGSELERLAATLSDEERERAGRFVRDLDRQRFVVAHGRMRGALAMMARANPAALQFCVGAHGKPALGTPHARLSFSLSHSHDRALLAVSVDRAVGVDIEARRPDFDWAPIARTFFAPAERDAIAQLPAPLQRDTFFACWTRKEAYLKARGDGFLGNAKRFAVSVLPPPATSEIHDGQEVWTIADIAADPDFAASVAWAAGSAQIVQWTL